MLFLQMTFSNRTGISDREKKVENVFLVFSIPAAVKEIKPAVNKIKR